jgi:excisionase family DNA binding protein
MIEHQTSNQNDSPSIERLLSVAAVASILGVSPKMVHKLARERKLACVQVTARDRRFTPEQVQEYIRSHSKPVRVDKKDPRPVQSSPKKGGPERKSAGDIGTDLVKEIRSLCR